MQAGSLYVAAMTGLQGYKKLGYGINSLEDLQNMRSKNLKILVIGASGGVGIFAAQFAKLMGADVWGVCSGRNEEFVKTLGVSHILD